MADFTWRVAANGYAWAEDCRESYPPRGGSPPGKRLLVPRDLLVEVEGLDAAGFEAMDARGVAFRSYDPFGQTGMFRDFAGTPPTEDGIRAFADRYGTLGADGAELWPAVPGSGETEDQREGHERIHTYFDIAQTFDAWSGAIAAMKGAVGLFDHLTPNRTGTGARKLQEQVQGRLAVTGVVARFQLDPPPLREAPLHLAPINLHGAMWLQLARAVSGNKSHRQCAQCGRSFELSPEINRTSRRYCSERCRSQAYRERKAAALKLRAAGRTVRQIADELGSDQPTVRKWLGERAGK